RPPGGRGGAVRPAAGNGSQGSGVTSLRRVVAEPSSRLHPGAPMATKVLMPKWGMSMQEGLVCSWLKKEGDAVAQGEPIVEVESSKATNLVEAPASGVLARILVPEGKTVPITTAIAVIAAPGEEIPGADEHSRGERPPPAERAGSSAEAGQAEDRPDAAP